MNKYLDQIPSCNSHQVKIQCSKLKQGEGKRKGKQFRSSTNYLLQFKQRRCIRRELSQVTFRKNLDYNLLIKGHKLPHRKSRKEKLHNEAAVIFWFGLDGEGGRNCLWEVLAFVTKMYLKPR